VKHEYLVRSVADTLGADVSSVNMNDLGNQAFSEIHHAPDDLRRRQAVLENSTKSMMTPPSTATLVLPPQWGGN